MCAGSCTNDSNRVLLISGATIAATDAFVVFDCIILAMASDDNDNMGSSNCIESS
jgi:hypothetical protein